MQTNMCVCTSKRQIMKNELIEPRERERYFSNSQMVNLPMHT